MVAVVGLGNVGGKYKDTRHNVGFMFIDAFPQFSGVITLKPDTMMNASGKAVKKLADSYKLLPADIYVIHDDLDLPLGEYKIQFGKGPKVHNGVNSVEESLGTEKFWRVRIGVDNRDPDNRVNGEGYVLQKFSSEEKKLIGTNVIPRAIRDLYKLING